VMTYTRGARRAPAWTPRARRGGARRAA
jgi:hypothetical protein